MLSAPSLP